jgi:hypothetical protein
VDDVLPADPRVSVTSYDALNTPDKLTAATLAIVTGEALTVLAGGACARATEWQDEDVSFALCVKI